LKDYYAILGINADASKKEIKRAFRKLAQQYHPDRNPGDKSAEEKFKDISEAYEILSDHKKRAAFDTPPASSFDFGFDDMFGNFADFFKESPGAGRSSNRNTRLQLQLSFRDAIKGMKQDIVYPIKEYCALCDGTGSDLKDLKKCEYCHGSGKMRNQHGFFMIEVTCKACSGHGCKSTAPCVTCAGAGIKDKEQMYELCLPPGIMEGDLFQLSGIGDHIDPHRSPGDILIEIKIIPDEKFSRHQDDIHSELSLDAFSAIYGKTELVETLHGNFKVKIPPGINHGAKLRIPGQGIKFQDKSASDHMVNIKIVIPTLSISQQQQLQDFISQAGLNK
jgi:molecular chaperone DnaJ